MAEAEYEKIEKYILAIRESDRAKPSLYEKRLSVCKGCGLLNAGTCGACGCYVELRASVEKSGCPHKKW